MNILNPDHTQAKKKVLILLLLCTAVTAVFWQVTTFDFVNFDDPVYVTKNSDIQHGLNNDSIRWAFTTHLHGHYHPLTWITHIIDFRVYGMNPFGHHLTSLVLHILNTLLLFLVLSRMTGQTMASGFAAALFALHPLHVEPVAWIADRKDLLCGFFWIAALWLYIRIAERKSFVYHFLLVIVYALGLLSKSTMITLPLVLFLLDFWPLNRLRIFSGSPQPKQFMFPPVSPVRIIAEKSGLVLIAIAFSLISTAAMQDLQVEAKQLAPYWRYDFVLFITHYLQKFLWPLHLTALYPYAENPAPELLFICGAILAGITLAAIILYKRLPFLLTGWLWFVLTLLPVIGLIHGGPHRVADRYTYLPLIGLIIAVTWGGKALIERINGSKNILMSALAAMLLIFLCLLSYRQATRWQNSLSLFSHAVSLYPENWVAHNNLGDAYDMLGEKEKAIYHYQTALRIKPRFAKANYNLGNTLASLQRYDEALFHYREAIAIYPEFAEAYNNAGVLLAREKRYLPAKEYFTQAVRLDPAYEEAEKNLLDVSTIVRELEKEIALQKKQLTAEPENENLHNNLGLLYREGGDTIKAKNHFLEALRINPGFAGAHNNLGILLAEQGNLQEAKQHFQQAVDIDPDFSGARLNLERINAIIRQNR